MTATAATAMEPSASEKGFVPALLLCFFLGIMGVHRFYVGKIGTGILQLVTFGGFGIWALVDFIMIAVGSFRDAEGHPLKAGHRSRSERGLPQPRRGRTRSVKSVKPCPAAHSSAGGDEAASHTGGCGCRRGREASDGRPIRVDVIDYDIDTCDPQELAVDRNDDPCWRYTA